MISRLLISLSVLLIAAQKLCAQLAPAEDFFNGGAQLFISNNVPAALERVEMGLKTYPDDVKLKKLEELLKQKQQQQSQQNQQQQNQQSQSQPQKSDSQKQQEQQKSSAQKNEDAKQDKQDAEAQPTKPGELTKEEAKHLLDAQKDNEQILQMKPPAKPRNPDQPIRDW